jgi:hypothetical protein
MSGDPSRCDHDRVVEAAVRGFPAALAPTVRATLAPGADQVVAGSEDERVSVNGEQVCLPQRITLPPEPQLGAGNGNGNGNEVEPTILGCLATRHHDGFVRQRAVTRLLGATETWVVPYVVRLVGEYVLEIVETIAAGLDLRPGTPTRRRYGEFAAANPAALQLTRQRAISYWNAYHRDRFPVRCPGPTDRWPTYPAFPLLDTLHRAASEMREDVR